MVHDNTSPPHHPTSSGPPSSSSSSTTPVPATPAATTEIFVRGSVVPHLDTSLPAINAGAPAEIDGTPTSPDQQGQGQGQERLAAKRRVGSGGGATAAAAAAGSGKEGGGELEGEGGAEGRRKADEEQRPVTRSGSSPDYLAREGEVLEEFGLSGGLPAENRAARLQSRKSDPAVLVDIPQGPSVEDFAAAGLLSPIIDDKKAQAAV